MSSRSGHRPGLLLAGLVVTLGVTGTGIVLATPSSADASASVPADTSVVAASASPTTGTDQVHAGPTEIPRDFVGEELAIEAPNSNIVPEGTGIVAEVEDIESTEINGDTTTVVINSDVLFDFDSAELTDEAKDYLDSMSSQLDSATGTIAVDGYTDDKGSPDYNQKLSEKRADAVVKELQKSLPDAEFEATGHGEKDPIADNQKDGKDDPQGMAKNRRVTISYEG